MDRDAAGYITELAVGVGLALHRHGQIGVFDDDELAVLRAEMAELLLSVGLRDHLARHLGTAQKMPTDEGRVDDAHEGVIDLEVTERVDAFALH